MPHVLIFLALVVLMTFAGLRCAWLVVRLMTGVLTLVMAICDLAADWLFGQEG